VAANWSRAEGICRFVRVEPLQLAGLRPLSPTKVCEAALNGLSPSAQAFAEQVFRVGSWRAELPPTTSFSLKGAQALSELVMAHPAITGDRRPDMQLRLFGPTDDDGLEALRGHSVGYLLAGTIALGMIGTDIDDDLAAGLIHAAAAPEPESLLQRANLLRERLFESPPPVIPDWLEEIERFVARNCFAGVMKAVLELGRWSGSRSTSYASGISRVTPPNLCKDALLTLHGPGLGSGQPAGVVVYVPTLGGGCREAKVESWSDKAVVVRAPADIGAGCVGFVKLGDEYYEPQRVTGELTACIGAGVRDEERQEHLRGLRRERDVHAAGRGGRRRRARRTGLHDRRAPRVLPIRRAARPERSAATAAGRRDTVR
jgi:hypothetical protein